jgi:hypothetical protein
MDHPPLLNILIRTSGRPKSFARCIQSIREQDYPNIMVIVCYDDERWKDYIITSMKGIKTFLLFKVPPQTQHSNFWNLYCNDLKNQVMDGFFFYLDDDDYLANSTAVSGLAKLLDNEHVAYICQFLRNGKPKPPADFMERNEIRRGKIGGSCLVLKHSVKNWFDWDGEQAADYRFICQVAAMLKIKFIQHVLVAAGNGGNHGKPEIK